ncbi:hypothetical protein [Sphingomonas sp.]|jgi:hypothetical protein|uniref:hypothetical protein n=1 Tax=Sphingomonas sp. TaxID=28214 RepID=UPI002626C9BD|nr:hypothetical protein [Sphingomonas sp.]
MTKAPVMLITTVDQGMPPGLGLDTILPTSQRSSEPAPPPSATRAMSVNTISTHLRKGLRRVTHPIR